MPERWTDDSVRPHPLVVQLLATIEAERAPRNGFVERDTRRNTDYAVEQIAFALGAAVADSVRRLAEGYAIRLLEEWDAKGDGLPEPLRTEHAMSVAVEHFEKFPARRERIARAGRTPAPTEEQQERKKRATQRTPDWWHTDK